MGNVKMVNMLTTSFISHFLILRKKCAIDISQDFFCSESVHELPGSIFSSLIDLK